MSLPAMIAAASRYLAPSWAEDVARNVAAGQPASFAEVAQQAEDAIRHRIQHFDMPAMTADEIGCAAFAVASAWDKETEAA